MASLFFCSSFPFRHSQICNLVLFSRADGVITCSEMEGKCSEGIETSVMDLKRILSESAEAMCLDFSSTCLSYNSFAKKELPVEVCLKSTSTARRDVILHAVESMLERQTRTLKHAGGPIALSEEDDKFLYENVQCISICDSGIEAGSEQGQRFSQVAFKVFVYQLNEEGPGEEIQGGDSIASFQDWLLPAKEIHGLWESLILEKGLKQRLLQYATSALLFGDKGVNPHLVSWNRVILLHGPPGSGKTSLCKALAQKLSIRFSHRYAQTQLVEVDAHSLFSKWFSESGKLVTKLFQRIYELAEEGDTLVFVLIDEVESLAAARQAALCGSEPSDSIRAVNALLTQLDRLKTWSNVVVLTTSNITAAIDVAFVDRADIKVFIGPPTVAARYNILRSCINELLRADIISMQAGTDGRLLTYETLQSQIADNQVHDASFKLSELLLATATACQGLSGRALRKLPFLAHAQMEPNSSSFVTIFLLVLHRSTLKEIDERSLL